MPGPRYCILCGESFQGGRVDRLYCGANCRTRACRMRKRGEPIRPSAAPQPISLSALLSDGVPCPCCGVRIVLHATASQAGVPDGYTTAARSKLSAEGHVHVHAPRSGPRSPRTAPPSRQRTPPAAKSERADGRETGRHESLHLPLQSFDSRAGEAVQKAAGIPAGGSGAPLGRKPVTQSEQNKDPAPSRTTRQAVQARPAHQPARTPTAVSSPATGPASNSLNSLPAGFFRPPDLRLPSYDDLCEYTQIYVSAAAVVILHGDPWQNNSQQLKRLVSDILTAIEEELTTGRYSTEQATKEWFQTQRATLILVGATIALAARALSPLSQGRMLLVELTIQAIERFVQVMTLNYPGDAIAIREWYRTNSQLVYVVGVSVTRALMVAGALDAPSAHGEETSSDDVSDDVSNEADLVEGDEADDQEEENAGGADGEREDDEEPEDGEDIEGEADDEDDDEEPEDGEDADIEGEADDEDDDEEPEDGEVSEFEEDTDGDEQDDAGEADTEEDEDEDSDDDSSELLGQDDSGEEEDLEDDPEEDSEDDD